MNQNSILRLSQIIGDRRKTPPIEGIIPVSRSTWYRCVRSGLFPKAVSISPRCVGWRQSDIESLLTTLGGPSVSMDLRKAKPSTSHNNGRKDISDC